MDSIPAHNALVFDVEKPRISLPKAQLFIVHTLFVETSIKATTIKNQHYN